MFRRACLVLVPCLLSLATAQDVPDNQINSIAHYFTPDERISGGIRSVMDKVHNLDTKQGTSCGKRTMCEAMAESYIERSDGQFEFQRGFLRDIVDRTIDLAIDAVSPLLHMAGMGAFARREISFFNFVIDMVDSSLIWAGRVLAGRRFSRQIEAAGPFRSLLSVVPKPPFRHLPDIVDLAVDLTGAFDRKSGSFQYMRAGLMGYWKGGEIDEEDSGICDYLYSGDEDVCSSYWGIIPMMNTNSASETLRAGPTNPLANKAKYKFSGLQWEDLADPKKVLCKIDNYLGSIDGHVNSDPDTEEGVDQSLNEIVIVRRRNDETEESMKIREEKECLNLLKEEEVSTEETDNEDDTDIGSGDYDYEEAIGKEASVKEANMDKFTNYCVNVTEKAMNLYKKEEKRRMCKKIIPKSESGSSKPLSFVQGIKFVGKNPLEPFISTTNDDDKEDDTDIARSNINIEILAKLHDQTILVDKIQVNENPDMDMDQASEIIQSLGIEGEEGAIESVYRLATRKGTGLLLQLDSTEFRDQIIKQYRKSSITAKLRKPKGKDLKQIVSLVTESL